MIRPKDIIQAFVEADGAVTTRILFKQDSVTVRGSLLLFVLELVVVNIPLVCGSEFYLMLLVPRVLWIHLLEQDLSICQHRRLLATFHRETQLIKLVNQFWSHLYFICQNHFFVCGFKSVIEISQYKVVISNHIRIKLTPIDPEASD